MGQELAHLRDALVHIEDEAAFVTAMGAAARAEHGQPGGVSVQEEAVVDVAVEERATAHATEHGEHFFSIVEAVLALVGLPVGAPQGVVSGHQDQAISQHIVAQDSIECFELIGRDTTT